MKSTAYESIELDRPLDYEPGVGSRELFVGSKHWGLSDSPSDDDRVIWYGWISDESREYLDEVAPPDKLSAGWKSFRHDGINWIVCYSRRDFHAWQYADSFMKNSLSELLEEKCRGSKGFRCGFVNGLRAAYIDRCSEEEEL